MSDIAIFSELGVLLWALGSIAFGVISVAGIVWWVWARDRGSAESDRPE